MTHILALTLFSLLVFSGVAQVGQDPYCIENSSEGTCSKCINFFYLKDRQCARVSPSCETYHNQTGDCLTCVNGFKLNQGKCEGPVQGFGKQAHIGSAEQQINSSVQTGSQQPAPTQNAVGLPPVRSNLFVQAEPLLISHLVASSNPGLNANGLNFPSSLPLPQLPPISGSNTQASLNPQISDTENPSGFIFFGGDSDSTGHTPAPQPTSNADHQVTTTVTTTTTVTSTNLTQPQTGPSLIQTQDSNPYGYPPGFMDPYCQQYDQNQRCIRCATRFFFNLETGLCSPIDPQCNTFNDNGQCLTCYPGYSLSNGRCIVTPNQPSDQNCRTFDPSGKCLDCYTSFILTNGVCRPVNPQCKDYNRAGGCTDCYAGYTLKGTECIVTPQNVVNSQDLCKERGANNQCTSCFGDNSVVNGVCVPSLSLCQAIDSQSNCVSCYSGYTLKSGRCIVSSTSDGCSRFDNQGRCIQCSRGYYFQGGICRQANPLCQTFNQNTGACQTCYPGYSLVGSTCAVTQNTSSGDPNCFQIRDGVCVACSNRFVMINGKCSPVNDYCNTYDKATGDCTSCYGGFVLRYGYCYKTVVGGGEVQQPQLPQLPQLPQPQSVVVNQTVQSTDSTTVSSPTSEQIFYEWLNKDTPNSNPAGQGYVFSTENNQGTLDLSSNTSLSKEQPAATEKNLRSELPPSSPQITVTRNESSTNISTPTLSPISLPPLNTTQHTPTLPTLASLSPQPSPLFINFTSSQSTPLHSGNPCLKYDTDGITCLQCQKSWSLTSGNCLLGGIIPPSH